MDTDAINMSINRVPMAHNGLILSEEGATMSPILQDAFAAGFGSF